MSAFPWHMSAADLALAIRTKQLSCRESVDAHLNRIDAVNPHLNAVTIVLADEALRAADDADRRIQSGDTLGPLHGVPITVKENLDLVGSATTHGLVALAESRPTRDAPVVAHLKNAGAIPIGRTNLPDFGLRWHTDNDLRGATINPWDPSRTPGGSSGGEAAAIATGMSPLGIGNDMGGSLRYPAQCCGIAALKPGLGRVSRTMTHLFESAPLFYEQVAAVNGPMARHVRDLRLALDVISRPDPEDPTWTPAPRVGADRSDPAAVALAHRHADPFVAAGLRRAADILSTAGYRVEEVEPPMIAEAGQVLETIANTETASGFPEFQSMMSEDGRSVLTRIMGEVTPNLIDYMSAIAQRFEIERSWLEFMQQWPLVLGPVSSLSAREAGFDLGPADQLARFIESLVLTETCNLLGLPSVAVPVLLADGMPQAVQLIGPRFHEDLCLDAAEVIEGHQGVFTPIDPRPSKSNGSAA